MPANTVNASHWYDVVTLVSKRFRYPNSFDPATGAVLEGRAAIEGHYTKGLARIKDASKSLAGGDAPTLIGEFGIPYDLDGGQAYGGLGERRSQ